MLSFVCSAWLLALASATCRDGYFTTSNNDDQNPNYECRFKCYDGDDSYISNPQTNSALTFNTIVQSCYDTLQVSLRLDECGNTPTKADLVWPDDSDCSCPYCSCASQTDPTFRDFEKFVRKECHSCSCSSVNSNSDLGYQCEDLFTVYDPYNWNDFMCEANMPTCSNGDDTYYPTQGFFEDTCTSYCYCSDSGKQCAEITEIPGLDTSDAGNAALRSSFLDENAYRIRDCMDDTSRIFQTSPENCGGSWSDLRCSCPSGRTADDGVYWFSEYDDSDDGFQQYGCARCTCVGNSQYDYVDCDSLGGHATQGQCIEANVESVVCHNDWGESSDCSDCTHGTKGSFSAEYCGTTTPKAYCGWDYDEEPDEQDDWWWGCGNDLLCGAYSELYPTGTCWYSEYSVTFDDCNGETKTEARTQYEMCCDTDNCNYVDISIDNCVKNTQFSNVLETLYMCMAAQGSGDMFDDDCEVYEEQEVTCASIEELYTGTAICYCQAYRSLYQDSPSEWQVWIQEQIDMMFDSWSRYNDALGGCDFELTCDLDGESGVQRYGLFAVSVVFGLFLWVQ